MTTPATSLAAVFTQPNHPLELRNLSLPPLAAGEALVRITCCTICGSDLHTFTGARSSPAPSVLGHEILGIVEAVSGNVTDVAGKAIEMGDRITWSVAASCGTCERCDRRMPQKCESLFKYGHELCADGAELNGGLAEHCVLKPGTAIVRLPEQLPDTVACPVNCATATVAAAFAAAVRQDESLRDRRVLIYGAGMLGLTSVAFAKVAGAANVTVCDVNETRRELAMKFGATNSCAEVTADDFDCVFEMSGHPAAVHSAINAAGIGGRIVLVGSVSPSPPVNVDPERIVRRLLSIHGVHNYAPKDLQTAVNFLTEHHANFPFATLVEASYSLNDVNDAFQYAVQQRPIRVAVRQTGESC